MLLKDKNISSQIRRNYNGREESILHANVFMSKGDTIHLMKGLHVLFISRAKSNTKAQAKRKGEHNTLG